MENLIAEIFEALTYFIEQQQLVMQVMQELDISVEDVGRWGAAIWTQQGKQGTLPTLPESASDPLKELWSAVQQAQAKRSVSQQGVWGKSKAWHYFLHGKGCRLSNTLTGEVIDWDCPNVDAFDRFSFLKHLRWRLEVEPEENLPLIRQQISQSSDGIQSIASVIEEMREMQLINSDWTLPKTTKM